MDDTKFNISGEGDQDKDKEQQEPGAEDFEFQIERSKKESSSDGLSESQEPQGQEPSKEEQREEEPEQEAELDFSFTGSPGPESSPEPEEEILQEEAPTAGIPTAESSEEPSEEQVSFESAEQEQGQEQGPGQEAAYLGEDSGLELAGVPKGLKVKGAKAKARLERFRKGVKKSPLTFILFALAGISLLLNFIFVTTINSAKDKIKNNAILANKFALEKDSLREEKEELEAKIKELERNLLLEKKVNSQIYEEKDSLAKELEEVKESYSKKAVGSLQKYAKEAKLMAEKMLRFKKAYEKDRQAYQAMAEENKKLKKEMAELNQSFQALKEKTAGQEATFLYNLGVAYARGGLYDEALEAFTDSLSLNPNNPEAHYNLALIYETVKGENAKAIKHYQDYLKSVPDTIERYKLEVKIDSLRRVLKKKNKYSVLDSK